MDVGVNAARHDEAPAEVDLTVCDSQGASLAHACDPAIEDPQVAKHGPTGHPKQTVSQQEIKHA